MLAASISLIIISGVILYWIRPHQRAWAGWLSAMPPLAVTVWQVAAALPSLTGSDATTHGDNGLLHNSAIITEQYRWIETLGLELSFRLDGLSLLFGLIISGIGAAVALYTHYYLESDERQGYFYLTLFAFMASMLGLVWADNLLTLFVFWEGTSVTSYLLIAYSHQSAVARGGARNAFVVTAGGGLALIAGMILLGQQSGTYTISEIVTRPGLTELDLYPPILILILLGAFTKSAQFPFHWWLPGAMAAPTPASAYLHSATMVKAGIYLLARLHPALSDHPMWLWGLLSFGAVTMLVGAVSAVRHWDMKALLAYATVSQLGVLTTLLAFRSEAALLAVVVGILSHALYKGPLFLVAGIVDHATGVRDLRKLAGLRRSLPVTTWVALLAVLSMAGFPPLFGFVAKEALLESFFASAEHGALAGWIAFGAAAVAGAFFVNYSLTLMWEAFLRPETNTEVGAPLEESGGPAEETHVHHAPPPPFVAAPLVLVACGTLAPFVLGLLDALFSSAAASIAGAPVHKHVALWHGFSPVFLTSLLAIAAGFWLFLNRSYLRRALASLPESLRGVVVFQNILDGIYAMGQITARFSQGYTLATQAAIVFLAAFVPVAVALRQVELSDILPWNDVLPGAPETILILMLVVSAYVTVRIRTSLGAIVSLGVVGVSVTLFYVFFSAPDLALTQLLIEVLTVVLLVIVFTKLPPDIRPPMQKQKQARNVLVALAAGAFGFFLVLFNSSDAMQAAQSISGYFLHNAVPGGHGSNVVNVILVDFRAFDTMGEITVLALAALGGYALLNAPRVNLPSPLSRRRDPEHAESRSVHPIGERETSSAKSPVKAGEK
ncbi:MAG: proton-conducting transporter membrane subunit [Caldilineaceae bacterium]|nr:proton-conducting transporter membrane subunit [Caldilineaceae bacterium]